MLNESLFNSWVEKEKKVSKERKRKYPHFDPKINFFKNIAFFKTFFSKKENVAKHSFYPFIRIIIETPRYKKQDEKGRPVRKTCPKLRPLAYSSHFDAFVYSYYSTLLTAYYENIAKEWGIYDNILAYLEKGKSNIEYAHEIFEYIINKGECVALAFDVSSFFDGLDHEHLKKMWSRVIDSPKLPDDHFKVFKSLTDYTFVDKSDLEKEFPHIATNLRKKIYTKKICEPKEFRERVRKKGLIKHNTFKIAVEESQKHGCKCGIPQGSPMSACLSNIYMLNFDIRTKDEINKFKGIYRRYCDDIIVIVDIKDAEAARVFILDEIKRYHLEINDDKTEITYFINNNKEKLRAYNNKLNYSNLQYLGFEFNGQNTYIRSSSMSRYYRRMTARVRENLKAAYGKNAIGDKVFRKKLYLRYTEKGKRNFISYAARAAEHMKSSTIKKQYKNNIKKVKTKFNSKKKQFEDKRKPNKTMK